MSCQIRSEEHTDRLLAYSAGKLRGETAAEAGIAHALVRGMRGRSANLNPDVWNLLDNWEVRPVSVDFNRQLYAKIDAASSVRRGWNGSRPL